MSAISKTIEVVQGKERLALAFSFGLANKMYNQANVGMTASQIGQEVTTESSHAS